MASDQRHEIFSICLVDSGLPRYTVFPDQGIASVAGWTSAGYVSFSGNPQLRLSKGALAVKVLLQSFPEFATLNLKRCHGVAKPRPSYQGPEAGHQCRLDRR